MSKSNLRAASVAALVVLAAAVAWTAPTAAAHTCRDHFTCDSSSCVNGENHDHTDLNDPPHEDTNCTSKASDDPDNCEFLGQTWPPLVCKLVGDEPDLTDLPLACFQSPQWSAPDLGGWGGGCP